jgi:hypothetical protein
MPARTKRRRKLQVGDRLFLFWHDDWEIHVASKDKRFVIVIRHVYPPWGQRQDDFLPMKVCGPEFPALEEIRQRPLLVAYPERDLELTPGAVRRLIDWCFTPGQTVRWTELSQPPCVVDFSPDAEQEERS